MSARDMMIMVEAMEDGERARRAADAFASGVRDGVRDGMMATGADDIMSESMRSRIAEIARRAFMAGVEYGVSAAADILAEARS